MNNRDKLMKHLMLDDLSANDLSDRTGMAPSNVRRTLDPLVISGVVKKLKSGRETIYSLEPAYAIGLPTFLARREGRKTLSQLQDLLLMYNADWTVPMRRLSKLPVYAALLLHVGLKYEQLHSNVSEDTESYTRQYNKLMRELRIIKTDLQEDYDALFSTVSIFQQLLNDDTFWKPEVLAKHFSKVTERNGRTREVADRSQVMSIVSDYVRERE